MPIRAHGTFNVKLAPLTTNDASEAAETPKASPLARMSIDKDFQGDLEGTSQGEMLSAITGVKGSAAYVAIELVTATLAGRSGSFLLQHTGIMNRGAPQLTISVVPDSGTGGLEGLTGAMSILISGGQHSYDFDYDFNGPRDS